MSELIAKTETTFEGFVRGRVIAYKVRKSGTSKSVGIKARIACDEWWSEDDKSWCEWPERNDAEAVFVDGTIWVVGKTGELIQDNVRRAAETMGWDGDFNSIHAGTWEATPVSGRVKKDTGEDGKLYYELTWIDPYDYAPGSSKSDANDQEVAGLQTQYGSNIRAILGNQQRNEGTTPGTRSKATPGSTKSTQTKSANSPGSSSQKPHENPQNAAESLDNTVAEQKGPVDDDIPF